MRLSRPYDGITLDLGTDAGIRAVETMIQERNVTLRIKDPPCGHRVKLERLTPVSIPLVNNAFGLAVVTRIEYIDGITRDVTLRGVGIATPR